MTKKSSSLLFLIFFILCSGIYSQGVYTPVTNNVYDFLERMSLKGVVNYSNLITPKTRLQIADHLKEIYSNLNILNKVEKDELNWFLLEYKNELDKVGSLSVSEGKRWRLFQYRDSLFSFTLDPILGFSINSQYSETQLKRWNGGLFYASLGSYFGGQMEFRDNWEKGKFIDRTKEFGKDYGINIVKSSSDNIEYSEIQGAVSFESKYTDISLAKSWINWGSSYNSKLILSSKPPSFPYFRWDLRPVNWLNFSYIFGILNSNILDSNAEYNTSVLIDINNVYRKKAIDRSKYYVAHIIEIIPFKDLRVSLGESIVYSDQLRLGFFIPFLFFRAVDHYYENQNGGLTGGNSQLFFDINYKFLKKFNVYGTLFIDEISLDKIFEVTDTRNQLGYTIGGSIYDFGIANCLIRFEYTKILPWVYSNQVSTQTYRNSGYLLGHYIGQNSDQLFFQIDYRLIRGLLARSWFSITRNGGFSDITEQYQPQAKPFLYSPVRNEKLFGIELSYEWTHDLTASIKYQYSNITDESLIRTPSYMSGTNNLIGFSLFYGL